MISALFVENRVVFRSKKRDKKHKKRHKQPTVEPVLLGIVEGSGPPEKQIHEAS